jgi:DNA polymerase-3 subunit alpha
MSFVHLHTHTHYSILEGLPKPADYIAKAVEYKMSALAITDTGNLHGCHEFYKTCKKEGINPILGSEIYVKSETDERLNHKLVLLATSGEGYRNIISLASKASLDNAGQTPAIHFEDLKNFSKDVVCLSGPIG